VGERGIPLQSWLSVFHLEAMQFWRRCHAVKSAPEGVLPAHARSPPPALVVGIVSFEPGFITSKVKLNSDGQTGVTTGMSPANGDYGGSWGKKVVVVGGRRNAAHEYSGEGAQITCGFY